MVKRGAGQIEEAERQRQVRSLGTEKRERRCRFGRWQNGEESGRIGSVVDRGKRAEENFL